MTAFAPVVHDASIQLDSNDDQSHSLTSTWSQALNWHDEMYSLVEGVPRAILIYMHSDLENKH